MMRAIRNVHLFRFLCLPALLISSLASWHPAQAAPGHSVSLTLEDRVHYQRAIEQVYWNHRIWPKQNQTAKPPLGDRLNEPALRAKVEDYIKKSTALETYWHRPIRPEQLQAEINRMARNSKNPEFLRELFAALDNDPYVIAECLGRPALADRLIRNRYASDSRFHGAPFDAWWSGRKQELIGDIASAPGVFVIPVIRVPSIETWTDTSMVGQPEARTFHTAVWTGSEMIVWGGSGMTGFLNTGGRYDPATDTWTAISTSDAPAPRAMATAVWTGSEMIVWGGAGSSGEEATGGRYNPSTDSWMATDSTNAPSARTSHTAVWTGSEMVVWGGFSAVTGRVNSGGRYTPFTDSWADTTTTGAPEERSQHTVIWTGNEMIVWGGSGNSGDLGDGSRYDPAIDFWSPVSATDAPAPRNLHTAVWTGSQMIVWGGTSSGVLLDTGAQYDPSIDTWVATAASDAPAPRVYHSAVWTGDEMLIWGGLAGSGDLDTGSGYAPSTSSWTAITSINAPAARESHTAVWTDLAMIVWGGSGAGVNLDTGGIYRRVTNTPPVADDLSLTTDENTPVDVVLTATDAEGDSLTFNVLTLPVNGLLSGMPPNLTYTPDAGFTGTDSFTFLANDGISDSNIATVDIAVAFVNDPPDAVDDAATTPQNTPVTINVLANDSDPEGDALTVSAVTQGANGTVVNNGDGTVTYTPNSGFGGADAFTYTISDGNGGSDTATVNITVETLGCLFCDDFEDGVLADDWTYRTGHWSESGGDLVASARYGMAAALASPVFAGCLNCSVEATMSTSRGFGSTMSLLGWYVNKKNNVELVLIPPAIWMLKQRSHGRFVAHSIAFAWIRPNVFYDVVVSFDGTRFTVQVDGTELMHMTPGASVPSGTVGFKAKNTTAHFGEITVE